MNKLIQNIIDIYLGLKEYSPLIHCITNPISINDCANGVLALGGIPIMAEHPAEVAEITATASALALNLGNITDARLQAMPIATEKALEKSLPVTIDMVGTACSTLRLEYAQDFLQKYSPALIKGNISELRAICGLSACGKGIDAGIKELVTEENHAFYAEAFMPLAKQHNCIILISGPIDMVIDQDTYFLIENGSPLLGKITGTGCMLNVLSATCLAMSRKADISLTHGTIAAAAILALAGEKADNISKGPGSFHTNLFDCLYALTPEDFKSLLNIKEF